MAPLITTQTFFSGAFLLIFHFVQFQAIMVQPQTLKPHKDQAKHHAFAKSYLKAYGYLRDNQDGDDVASGIRKFQAFYRLNVSGKLDPETIKAMERPRCGVPGHRFNTSLFNNSKYVILPNNPTWPPSKRNLTYSFDPSGINGDVSLSQLRQAFLLVFGQWTRVTKFTFNEVVTGKTDIVIGLYSRDRGDGAPFDGPGGIWAYATPPPEGILHFDADERWSNANQRRRTGSIWCRWVCMKLIIGLAHSEDPNAVMFAFINSGQSKRILTPDDIAGIQAIYPN